MKAIATTLPEVLLLQWAAHHDARGWFSESFNQQAFTDATGVSTPFVQDNLSLSHYGVLRGLHWQAPPKPQGKLVRVLRGRVWDVVVDARPESAHFKQWLGLELSEDDAQWLWIPPGFAHGFLSLAEPSLVLYKTTAYYAPEHERAWAWDDPALNISWPPLNKGQTPLLSARDGGHNPLELRGK